MWWAVQTLTSLASYGDFAPETFLGKVVGSCCAVCGVLVMALPIPIVVDNFADYYSEQKKLEAKEMKKEAQQKQAELEMAAAQVNFIKQISKFLNALLQVANEGLVATMCSKPSAFSTPPLSPCDGFSRQMIILINNQHFCQ